jgi:hypothetical protein
MGRFIDFQTKICAPWLNAVDDIAVACPISQEIVATAGQTVFPVNYTPGYIAVAVNGARLGKNDYTASSGTAITLSYPLAEGDLVACYTDSLRNTPNPV